MDILTKKHEKCAKLCQDVYVDDHLKTYDHIDQQETDMQVAFVVEEEELIIVFRGSDSSTDWFHNFWMAKTEYPKGSGVYVHSGFLSQVMSIRTILKRKIKTHIEDSKGSIKKITFTGHSAGINCQLAAYLSIDDTDLPIEVITFGAPYMGNKKFKEIMESRCDCTRIVLDRDIITRMPLVPGYVHCGKPIQIRNKEVLQRETSSLEHIHWLLLGAPSADFGVKDHLIWRYYGAIKKWVNGSIETDSES